MIKFPIVLFENSDWIGPLASISCIFLFLTIGAAITWTEFHGDGSVDSKILIYILGFLTREVGALSIGKSGNSSNDDGDK